MLIPVHQCTRAQGNFATAVAWVHPTQHPSACSSQATSHATDALLHVRRVHLCDEYQERLQVEHILQSGQDLVYCVGLRASQYARNVIGYVRVQIERMRVIVPTMAGPRFSRRGSQSQRHCTRAGDSYP